MKFGNVFADLGFEAEEAQNLLLRSQTMMAITQWYEASGLTQAGAAKAFGITQPRVNQLLRGKIGEFSLDALVNMAARVGMRVGLTIKPGPRVKAVSVEAAPAKPRRATRKKSGELAAA
jgi:predicted XRE-type DNA-binding protein